MFLLLKGELEGRFDATAYKQAFNFKSKVFESKKLSEIAYINPNTSFKNLDSDSFISFVPMEAIDEENGTIPLVQTKKVAESKGFTRFQENDLIWAKITPCMQNGKSAIVRNALQGYSCGSTEFFVIRPKNENVKVEYLHILLRDKRVLENAQNYFGGSAGQQRVSKDFLERFPVPIPPLEIQQNIINIFENAYAEKKNKETQAKALLDSIDSYLLEELGITLPEKQENTLKNRVFLRNISEVSGGRLDSFYYSKNRALIEGGWFENKRLNNIAFIQKGQSITKDSIVEGKYFVIAGGQTSPYSHNQFNFEGKIITVSASGAYAGYVWYHDYPIFASDCNVIWSKNEEQIKTIFLAEILKLKQKEIYDLQQGAAQPHIYGSDLAQLQIPFPPLEIQEKIVAEITARREQAKRLQTEAQAVLENAKTEVEGIILGL